mmetsp:Transcript_27956/g.75327  ORF Transcript_27956/g.75327 Transcript_27956/m.75327 type:complete len:81 (+) Transcript_27956:794-1036(+)
MTEGMKNSLLMTTSEHGASVLPLLRRRPVLIEANSHPASSRAYCSGARHSLVAERDLRILLQTHAFPSKKCGDEAGRDGC